MNRIDDYHNPRHAERANYLIAWLILCLGVSMTISLLLPFPLSLLVSISILLLMDLFIARNAMRRYSTLRNSSLWNTTSDNYDVNKNTYNGKRKIRDGIKKFFNSLSSYADYPDPTALFGYHTPPVRFYCMSCGKEHRKRVCPNCGSKAVKVG
jgi:hypothetical protein